MQRHWPRPDPRSETSRLCDRRARRRAKRGASQQLFGGMTRAVRATRGKRNGHAAVSPFPRTSVEDMQTLPSICFILWTQMEEKSQQSLLFQMVKYLRRYRARSLTVNSPKADMVEGALIENCILPPIINPLYLQPSAIFNERVIDTPRAPRFPIVCY